MYIGSGLGVHMDGLLELALLERTTTVEVLFEEEYFVTMVLKRDIALRLLGLLLCYHVRGFKRDFLKQLGKSHLLSSLPFFS